MRVNPPCTFTMKRLNWPLRTWRDKEGEEREAEQHLSSSCRSQITWSCAVCSRAWSFLLCACVSLSVWGSYCLSHRCTWSQQPHPHHPPSRQGTKSISLPSSRCVLRGHSSLGFTDTSTVCLLTVTITVQLWTVVLWNKLSGLPQWWPPSPRKLSGLHLQYLFFYSLFLFK